MEGNCLKCHCQNRLRKKKFPSFISVKMTLGKNSRDDNLLRFFFLKKYYIFCSAIFHVIFFLLCHLLTNNKKSNIQKTLYEFPSKSYSLPCYFQRMSNAGIPHSLLFDFCEDPQNVISNGKTRVR